jgi:hypothetical protein
MSENQIKDKILEYCVEKDSHVSAHEIHKNLFPNISEEEIEDIFAELKNNEKPVGDIRISEYNCLIIPDGRTKSFLASGGFTEMERISKVQSEKDVEKENLELELARSNIEANKLNKKVARQNAKNEKRNQISTWINIGIGILNIVILIWQILKGK